ncbi:3-hydroxyacyl-CoA dehydrogenase [Rhodovulum bhavnagarense]|uniref:3-hydroxyacyl-CoA dehydrogenase n=1 Tax=Rhodovulum bhavnagarense TaxID=992286 RepID=A0A4R2RJD2_9RHOB|nr:enoyl-CoA hydratase-related protein [Rhodovulum bhavnagarense]TCP63173.1 3-hydroxyacyl-CoA dehydrogenase [Rhodovulum bhavnagarense]
MSQFVKLEEPRAGIVRLVMARPPANLLVAPMRRELDACLAAVLARSDLRGILLAGTGGSFSMGLNPAQAEKPGEGPGLAELCARIDGANVPVVAELQGMVMGGGAELAIAAHYRVALHDVLIGLPDVMMGLPPQAGTTQRLPRVVGAEAALHLMLTGQSLSAPKAQRAGLLDAVVTADLPGAGLRLVGELIDAGVGPRPASDMPVPDFSVLGAAVARRRASLQANSPVLAPARIVDCVEAVALLPYQAGLAFEAAAVEECLGTQAADAMRHAFLAERRAQKQANDWMVRARKVSRVGIWGTGTAAAGLAAGMLAAGSTVRMAARDAGMLEQGVAAVDGLFEAALGARRIDKGGREAFWARFSGGTGISALGDCELVFEAGTGPWAARARDLASLGAALPRGAILAATGPLASGPALVRAARRPAETLWLHMPELVADGRLAELVITPATAPDTVAAVAALARRMNRLPLPAQDESPLLGVLVGALEAADTLVEEGASPYAVDAALRAWGFSAGPFQLADRLGLETVLALRARLADGGDPVRRPILLPGQLVAEGRPGRTGGRGYYLYPGSAPGGQPDPAVTAIIASAREVLGLSPRAIDAQEICLKVLAGMAQAGARLLRRGVVRRADDIDLVMVLGAGIVRWRGGPMHAADAGGLLVLRRALLQMAERPGRHEMWTPDPLIRDLIKTGRHFSDVRSGVAGTGILPDRLSPA